MYTTPPVGAFIGISIAGIIVILLIPLLGWSVWGS